MHRCITLYVTTLNQGSSADTAATQRVRDEAGGGAAGGEAGTNDVCTQGASVDEIVAGAEAAEADEAEEKAAAAAVAIAETAAVTAAAEASVGLFTYTHPTPAQLRRMPPRSGRLAQADAVAVAVQGSFS